TEQTELPLPLGLNVVRRDLDDRFGDGTVAKVSRVLQRSVAYAIEHAHQSRQYLLLHAGDDRAEWRDDELVKRYLDMYVSRMSMDMGERGRAALERFLGDAHQAGLVPGCAITVV
ncbi:MAG: MqnA/MqnD/SBP family protein, partial [Planctomycetota bacterium]